MRIVRKQLFETNSSSTHALCIIKEDNTLDKSGDLHLSYEGEYGWQFDMINDKTNKFTYLAIIANNIDNDNDNKTQYLRELLEKLQEIGFTFDSILEEMYFDKNYNSERKMDSILEYLRPRLNNKNIPGSYSYYYIDHGDQAEYIFFEILKDIGKLKRYMLSPLSFIALGNDQSTDQDVFDKPNDYYQFDLPKEPTEWGTERIVANKLEETYDIYYKGN